MLSKFALIDFKLEFVLGASTQPLSVIKNQNAKTMPHVSYKKKKTDCKIHT